MKKIVLLIGMMLCCFACVSQTMYSKAEFEKFVSLFKEADFPLCTQDIRTSEAKIDSIQWQNILGREEEELEFDDWDANFDTGEHWENIKKCEPMALFKFKIGNITAVVYCVDKEFEGLNRIGTIYKAVLVTFDNNMQVVDSMLVRAQLTDEDDNMEAVFVDSVNFKVYEYMENPKRYFMRGTERVAIDSVPKTVCKISDYEIDKNGKIKKKGEPKNVYLKMFVDAYREKDLKDDNPVNEWMWDE